jgi:hypothetical protein
VGWAIEKLALRCRWWIIGGQEAQMLSNAALEMMKHIASLYLSKNHPNHRGWSFERPTRDRVFPELAHGHGLIVRAVGEGRAERYRLTDFGYRWVMAYRDVAVADAAY